MLRRYWNVFILIAFVVLVVILAGCGKREYPSEPAKPQTYKGDGYSCWRTDQWHPWNCIKDAQ